MRRAIALVTLGGVLTLLAVGCGGGGGSSAQPLDKATYVQQMRVIGRNLSTSLNGLGTAATSAKSAAAALVKVQTELRTAGTKINGMNPPTAVAAEQKKLGIAVNEFADELDPVIKQLQAGKLTALAGLGSLKGLKDIQTASSAIVSKGYKIGG